MSRTASPASRVGAVFLFVVLLVPFATPTRAVASSSFIVNSIGDDVDVNPGDGVCQDANGDCTLRAAIQESNALAGADVVTFSVSGTITVASDLPQIADDLTVIGNGAAETIIDGNGAYQGLNIGGGVTVNLIDMTIQNGNTTSGGGLNNAGTLAVTNLSVSNNHGSGDGGGIDNSGTLTITGSTLSGNTAPIAAGIFNTGTLTLTNSTLFGNHAGSDDAGILNGGTLTITNSTISGNSGGVYGGIHNYQGNTNLNNSIVADNTGTVDCIRDGGTINASHSLIGDDLSCINGTNTANLTGDPLLGSLADNGGPTQTMLLGDGSPAINAGDNALAVDRYSSPLTTDQRGYARIVGGTVDMGAVEAQMPVPDEIFSNGFD